MIHLTKPEKPLAVVRAIAGSGSSGLALKYQAENRRRTNEKLAREMGR